MFYEHSGYRKFVFATLAVRHQGFSGRTRQSKILFTRNGRAAFFDSRQPPWRPAAARRQAWQLPADANDDAATIMVNNDPWMTSALTPLPASVGADSINGPDRSECALQALAFHQ